LDLDDVSEFLGRLEILIETLSFDDQLLTRVWL
jgi:hypothetical protein